MSMFPSFHRQKILLQSPSWAETPFQEGNSSGIWILVGLIDPTGLFGVALDKCSWDHHQGQALFREEIPKPGCHHEAPSSCVQDPEGVIFSPVIQTKDQSRPDQHPHPKGPQCLSPPHGWLGCRPSVHTSTSPLIGSTLLVSRIN